MRRFMRAMGILSAVALLAGCAKTYVVTQPLANLLASPATIAVGAISDGLPVDMKPEDKPKDTDLQKLSRFLGEEIAKRPSLKLATEASGEPLYEVQGTVLEFKRGSGAVRFFIGFGLGNAQVTVGLKLMDKKTGEPVFAGNFTGTVSSWAEGGDQMFRRVSSSFAKELEQQIKKKG